MRRSKVVLTPTLCARTKSGERKKILWDAACLGLGLVITPGGARTWVFVPRRGQKQIWVRLGGYEEARGERKDEVWTVDAAREEAARLRKLHDLGRDVQVIMKERRSPHTIEELVASFKTTNNWKNLVKGTQRVYGCYLKHVLRTLGKRYVADLDHTTIKVLLLQDVEGKGTKVTAGYCVSLLAQILDYACDIGWRERGDNPCRKIKTLRAGSRSRVYTAWEFAQIHVAIGEGPQADLIRLLAFSGMRISEACGLQWSGVDMENKILTIFDHKTVKTMGAKRIPINRPMQKILKAQPRKGQWVFPGRTSHRGTKCVEVWWSDAVRGIPLENAEIHDLRRTFQTVGVELGYPPGDMDVLVGHKLPGMQATYIHLSPKGILAQASAITSAWIRAAMLGRNPHVGKRV